MRKCLGILMFALVPSFLWAIDLSMGLKFGSQWASLYGQYYETKKLEEKAYWDSAFLDSFTLSDYPTFGAYSNLFCTIELFDFFAIQPEVAFAYIKTGYELKYEQSGYYPFIVKVEYDYTLIELPLLLKGRIALDKRKTVLLNVFAGPDLLIDLTTPKLNYTINNGVGDKKIEEAIDPLYFKHGAWSVIFGLGLDYFLRSKYPWFFTLDARYNLNLTSFNNYPEPALNDTKMHMFVISVGIGWKLIKQGI